MKMVSGFGVFRFRFSLFGGLSSRYQFFGSFPLLSPWSAFRTFPLAFRQRARLPESKPRSGYGTGRGTVIHGFSTKNHPRTEIRIIG